jgi:putative GTP pyrophosphokinase
MKSSNQKLEQLQAEYGRRYDTVLVRLADSLGKHIAECLQGQPRIDRISARAKDIERFVRKASTQVEGKLEYSDPLSQIQDQIGARIIVFYQSDVERIDEFVKKYFRAIEYRKVVPDSESEFGYFGQHLILVLPTDIIEDGADKSLIPEFFELQIKTLFQHAWSEADHDLGYKPGEQPLTAEQKRRIAYTSAQAWGADQMFDQLFRERTRWCRVLTSAGGQCKNHMWTAPACEAVRCRPPSNCAKESIDLTNRRGNRCLMPCKIFGSNRTKMFHVKHFGTIADKCSRPHTPGRL